jgi:hypothetical protein
MAFLVALAALEVPEVQPEASVALQGHLQVVATRLLPVSKPIPLPVPVATPTHR